jgi:hypothetical protein
MTPMTPTQALERALRARRELARERATLPMPEKLRQLVELQRISLLARQPQGPGDRRCVWKLE